jgi:hypothetical protein
VIRGTVGGRVRIRSYTLAVGAGPLTATLAFTGSRALRLTLLPPAGRKAIARAGGTSALGLERAVGAGTIRFVVDRAAKATRFALTLRYARKGPARAVH